MNVFTDVNVVAVFAAAVANMVLGWVWYSEPVFGTKWMKLVGIKKKKQAEGMGKSLTIGFFAMLLQAYVMAVLLNTFTPETVQEALIIAVVFWLGLIVPQELGSLAWEKRPTQLFWINGIYQLLAVGLIAGILTWWPFAMDIGLL